MSITQLDNNSLNADISQQLTEAMKGAGLQSVISSLKTPAVEQALNDFLNAQKVVSTTKDTPTLAAPSSGPLSLETLLSAIGFEQRKLSCQQGIENLEAKGEIQEKENAKALVELQKQVEELAKQEALGPFKEAFQWIGAILGVVAAALSIGFGAVASSVGAGVPMVVGGVIALTMALDTVTSLATDGEKSIGAAISKDLVASGHSEEYAQKVVMGLSIGFALLGAALSLGGGIANAKAAVSAVANGAAGIAKMKSVGAVISAGTQMLSGANSIAAGGVAIADGVYSSNIMESEAEMKDIEAILEQIRFAMDMERDFVEAEMETANTLLAAVSSIVEDCLAAQSAVIAGTPSMA